MSARTSDGDPRAPETAAPTGTAPAEDAPPPETPEEARARQQREAVARELAERARLEQEQRERAAQRRRTLDDARALGDEESARLKAERAEQWRREQRELSRTAAEKASEKKRLKAEARREREMAAAATEARRAARAAARRQDAATASGDARPAPDDGPGDAPGDDPDDSARTMPSAAELAAMATPQAAADVPLPAARSTQAVESTRATQPEPTRAPSPASGGDRRPYSERYAEQEGAEHSRGRQVMQPRGGLGRRLLTVLLLALLVTSVALGYAAWQEPTLATVGLAGACIAVLLVVWAVRVTSLPALVVIDHGVLELSLRNVRHRFDLSTTYTQVETVGRPGRRGWKVRLKRGDSPPVVLDARTVNPREFTEALRRWRPEL